MARCWSLEGSVPPPAVLSSHHRRSSTTTTPACGLTPARCKRPMRIRRRPCCLTGGRLGRGLRSQHAHVVHHRLDARCPEKPHRDVAAEREVLVTGGLTPADNASRVNYLTSAELYNPSTGLWTYTGLMSMAHA